MDIHKIRNQIDGIDKEIINSLAKRFSMVQELAEIKNLNGLNVQDKKREEEIIKDRIKRAKESGIEDDKFVIDLFGLIMKEARQIQEKKIDKIKNGKED